MNKRLCILSAAAALIVCACATPAIPLSRTDVAGLSDGTYEGAYKNGPVSAVVKATVAGGKLVEAVVVKHDCGKGKSAERILADAVSAQSLAVDAVSGATWSSRVLLKALDLALEKAR
jgi:uncharacterized protein with FMN-binding domain